MQGNLKWWSSHIMFDMTWNEMEVIFQINVRSRTINCIKRNFPCENASLSSTESRSGQTLSQLRHRVIWMLDGMREEDPMPLKSQSRFLKSSRGENQKSTWNMASCKPVAFHNCSRAAAQAAWPTGAEDFVTKLFDSSCMEQRPFLKDLLLHQDLPLSL